MKFFICKFFHVYRINYFYKLGVVLIKVKSIEVGTFISNENNFDWIFNSLSNKHKNQIFRNLAIEANLIFFEHDPVKDTLKFTENFYKLSGYDSGSICNLEGFMNIVNSRYEGLSNDTYIDFLYDEDLSIRYEHQIVKKDGTLLWAEFSVTKVKMYSLGYNILYGFMTDISEHKLIELELLENKSTYELIFNGDQESCFTHNLETDNLEFTDSFYNMLGYEKGTINNTEKFYDILVTDNIENNRKRFNEFLKSDELFIRYEDSLRKKDGSTVWVTGRVKKVWLPKMKDFILVGIYIDITKRKEAEAKLKKIAYFDSVTELPNRRYFFEKLEEVVSNGTPGYLMLLDLDNFNGINDIYGYRFADNLLSIIADRINNALPKESFVARLSGDEFGIILSNASKEVAVNAIEEINDVIKVPFYYEQKKIFISACTGLVDLTIETDGSLLVLADIAMNMAKSNRKKRFEFFDSSYLSQIKREAEIETVLRNGIRDDELYCVFQPIFCAKTGRVNSFESLLRLQNKNLGFISPAEFIPIAEKNGLINTIGAHGIILAAEKISEWINKGYEINKFNFNISHSDVKSVKFQEIIKYLNTELGLDYNLLNVEVTESGLIEFDEEVSSNLDYLVDLGVNFSIDDFGTGFSSFRYLSEKYFNTLKIDMLYIQKVTQTENDKQLVGNLIKMAHALGMKVVAEGVETKEQYDILLELDCDYIQGYYLSRPLSANDAEELLKYQFVS